MSRGFESLADECVVTRFAVSVTHTQIGAVFFQKPNPFPICSHFSAIS
jgi:hypothetical protein